MFDNILSDLLNLIKVYNQKKVLVLKLKFSRKYVPILYFLWQQGLIRGFFISVDNKVKIVHVLLKHFSGIRPISYKIVKNMQQISSCTYKAGNTFIYVDFLIISNTKKIGLNQNKNFIIRID